MNERTTPTAMPEGQTRRAYHRWLGTGRGESPTGTDYGALADELLSGISEQLERGTRTDLTLWCGDHEGECALRIEAIAEGATNQMWLSLEASAAPVEARHAPAHSPMVGTAAELRTWLAWQLREHDTHHPAPTT